MIRQIYLLFLFLFSGFLAFGACTDLYITQNHLQSIQPRSNNQGAPLSDSPVTIVIDPGHGGKDDGCSTTNKSEKHLVLKFAKKLKEDIQKQYPLAQVFLTRDDDSFLALEKRIKLANDLDADLFISLHANAISDDRVNGFETYVYGKALHEEDHSSCIHNHLVDEQEEAQSQENSSAISQLILGNLQNNVVKNASIELATSISNQVSTYKSIKNRGLRQAKFKVLKGAQMPSILIELGFLTNKKDSALLSSESGQGQISTRIASGIINYLQQV